jgi:hypothetical protein
MGPGELPFLKRQLGEWEWEFGKFVIGRLAGVLAGERGSAGRADADRLAN